MTMQIASTEILSAPQLSNDMHPRKSADGRYPVKQCQQCTLFFQTVTD